MEPFLLELLAVAAAEALRSRAAPFSVPAGFQAALAFADADQPRLAWGRWYDRKEALAKYEGAAVLDPCNPHMNWADHPAWHVLKRGVVNEVRHIRILADE